MSALPQTKRLSEVSGKLSLSEFWYQSIAKSIGLPILPEKGAVRRSQYWDVIDYDQESQQYLLHYRPEMIGELLVDKNFTPQQRHAILSLRGVIYSDKVGRIVCRSYDYTPSITLGPEETLTPGRVYRDSYGFSYRLDAKATFQVAYEGTILRRYKVGGEVFTSTHKRIRVGNSKYGASRPFIELYDALGGPADDVLFDPEVETSAYCHVFLVSSPYLLVASKLDIGDGFVMHLETFTLADEIDPRDKAWYERWTEISRFEETKVRPDSQHDIPVPQAESMVASESRPVYLSSDIPLETANQVLRRGFAPLRGDSALSDGKIAEMDYRVRPGEVVIAVQQQPDGRSQMLKIHSQGYQWRSTIVGNDSNPYHRFYTLLEYCRPPPEEKRVAAPPALGRGRGRGGVSFFTLQGGRGRGDVKATPPPSSFRPVAMVAATGRKKEQRLFDGNPEQPFTHDELFPSLAAPRDSDFELLEVISPFWEVPADIDRSGLPLIENEVKKGLSDNCVRNMALCLAFALPISGSIQAAACLYYLNYRDDYHSALEWMQTNMATLRRANMLTETVTITDEEGKREIPKYRAFRKGAQLNPGGRTLRRLIDTSYGRASRGGRPPAEQLHLLLQEERGPSLYSLLAAVKRHLGRSNDASAQKEA